MIKTLAASALLGLAMLAPAYAQDSTTMMCDETSLTSLKSKVDGATDQAKKDAAMKEYDQAMAAMTAKDDAKCKEHMSATEKSLQ